MCKSKKKYFFVFEIIENIIVAMVSEQNAR
jgi:hypothetical protein